MPAMPADYPLGKFTPYLIGFQWVSGSSMAVINEAKLNRQTVKTSFESIENTLLTAVSTTLSEQEGMTAQDIQTSFLQGVNQAREIADRNGIAATSYSTAYDSVVGLRQELAQIAAEGNKQIDDIQSSKDPAPIKVGKVVAVITECQRRTNQSAAKYGANIIDAGQQVLESRGSGQSFRQVLQAQGIDPTRLFPQPDQKVIQNQVNDLLTGPNSTVGLSNHLGKQSGPDPGLVSGPSGVPQFVPGGAKVPEGLPAAPPPAASVPRPQFVPGGANVPANPPMALGSAGPGASSPGLALPASPFMPPPPLSAPAPHMPISPVTAAPMSPMAATPLAPTAGPPPSLAPTALAQDFHQGFQAAAPANIAPPPSMPPAMPQVLQPTPTYASGGSWSLPAAWDSPSPPPADYTPVASTPVMAAPAAPSPSIGPLPAYGADLRPTAAAASTPSAPLSPPPPATPISSAPAPTALSGSGQPAVVRRAVPSSAIQSPAGVGTEAAAVTAGGAAAGAASTDATARARLQRLVDAVARQQPRLAWAAGDRPDDTTVLVTDLAGGWIPPNIDLPAHVTLLDPERRRGNLESLLGEVKRVASYTPGHYIPEEDQPVAFSPRSRRAPEIEELGWELGQATNWRDGLPQLAHTLARAAWSGTGVLDSEKELLHDHLSEIAARALENYPDKVDPAEIGNWQLLAAIDALTTGDKTAANYHLAWFQALNQAASGGAVQWTRS
jgi:hypothetical protein